MIRKNNLYSLFAFNPSPILFFHTFFLVQQLEVREFEYSTTRIESYVNHH